MSIEYTVRTEAFEGPLGVLLNLIERRKLFINDISLAEIADDYIDFIKNRGDFSIRDSSDFVLITSALILIKSKSLLPNLDLTTEEEQNIENLEQRLKIYKQIRGLSQNVANRFGKDVIFSRNHHRNIEPFFSPDKNITPDNMFTSLVEVLTKIPKKEFVPKKSIQKVLSLEEMIELFAERIRKNIRMSFGDFYKKSKKDKVYVVISFLAMLELVKQNVIVVSQRKVFGEIDIENKDVDVPVY